MASHRVGTRRPARPRLGDGVVPAVVAADLPVVLKGVLHESEGDFFEGVFDGEVFVVGCDLVPVHVFEVGEHGPQGHADVGAAGAVGAFCQSVEAFDEFGFDSHRDHGSASDPVLLFFCGHGRSPCLRGVRYVGLLVQ